VERVGQAFVNVQTFSASTVELKAGETLTQVPTGSVSACSIAADIFDALIYIYLY
jgi:hypothetical protein